MRLTEKSTQSAALDIGRTCAFFVRVYQHISSVLFSLSPFSPSPLSPRVFAHSPLTPLPHPFSSRPRSAKYRGFRRRRQWPAALPLPRSRRDDAPMTVLTDDVTDDRLISRGDGDGSAGRLRPSRAGSGYLRARSGVGTVAYSGTQRSGTL